MLDNGLAGVGVKNTKVNRIILTRCERDLACILRKYQEIYKEDFLKKLKVSNQSTENINFIHKQIVLRKN